MTENVEVAVVGANLEEDVLWTVPLIDYFLDKVFAMIQSKANWPFVALAARVAVNLQLHLIIVAQNRFGPRPLDSPGIDGTFSNQNCSIRLTPFL
jgi:hypothetical protein